MASREEIASGISDRWETIKRSGGIPEGCITTRDLANSLGSSVDYAREVIRIMIDNGQVEPGAPAYVRSIDGRLVPVPTYRMIAT